MGRGEAAGFELGTSSLCTMFTVSGALGENSPPYGREGGGIKDDTMSPAPLRYSFLFIPRFLFSLPPFLPSVHPRNSHNLSFISV